MHADSDKQPAPSESRWRMFDRIARRYDAVNRILSFRCDVGWRERLRERLPNRASLRVLDLATGTGDVLLALEADADEGGQLIGLDMSGGMLSYARSKLAGRAHRCALVRGDAADVPLPEQSVDVVTMAFGIRNVGDVDRVLREMTRLLKPHGRALILEFSLPKGRILRSLYLAYLRGVVPRIGGWLSGDRQAYAYLNSSIEAFPYGEGFCAMMHKAGFRAVEATPLAGGIATLYQGDMSA